MRTTASRLLSKLEADEQRLLNDELACQEQQQTVLPDGVIHADLFRDNVLFGEGRLMGMIDFYTASNGPLIFDLAVTVNDWCVDESGEIDPSRYKALLQGYASERTLSAQELEAWPIMLRRAALRFWLSRLVELHFPRPGEMALIKDPGEFRRILELRVAGSPSLRIAISND